MLLFDYWDIGAIDSTTRSDLLEIIDDRAAGNGAIITSLQRIEYWHAWIGDATVAYVILYRLMQSQHPSL